MQQKIHLDVRIQILSGANQNRCIKANKVMLIYINAVKFFFTALSLNSGKNIIIP